MHNMTFGDNKILVTGGTGFIGEKVVNTLAKKYEIYVLTRNPQKLKESGIHFIKGDLSKKISLAKLKNQLKNVNYLVHIASLMPDATEPRDNLRDLINVNILGLNNLLEILPKDIKQIVLISSIDVYGNNPKLPIKEETLVKPQSNYAITKAVQEWILEKWASENKVKLTILRLSHTFGPGDHHGKVIKSMISQVLEKRDINIFGDGADLRDFVYVEDVANVILEILKRETEGIINIATGKSINLITLAKLILRFTDSKNKIVYQDRVKPRIDFVFDNSKMKKLGFKLKTNFKKGLREQILWIKKKG